MAYERPGVSVEHVFETPSPTVGDSPLSAVIVGECKQVQYRTSAGTYDRDDANDTVASYPALMEDAEVETGTVEVFVEQDDTLELIQVPSSGLTAAASGVTIADQLVNTIQASRTVTPAAGNILTDSGAAFVTNGVKAGDFIRAGSDDYEIKEVFGQTRLSVKGSFAAASMSYTVVRKLNGRIRISYVALQKRSALIEKLISYDSVGDLEEAFGKDSLADPRSILPFAAVKALQNSGGVVHAFCTDGDASEDATHLEAQAAIRSSKQNTPPYHIAPLTNTQAVLTSWATFVDTQEAKSAWHRVYLPVEIPDEAEQIATGTNGETDGTSNTLDGDTFTSSGATFNTAGSGQVFPGDRIVAGDETSYVESVTSDTVLELSPAITGNQSSLAFTIYRDYSRDELAEQIRAAGRGYDNQRVTLIGTDEWLVEVNDEDVICEGQFGAAARAGLAAGLAIGIPHTRKAIAGFDSIGRANDYFSPDQLDTMADGGVEVYVQETSSSPITIRDAITTDRSAFNREAVPMVIARDWLSYIIRDTLQPQIAEANITPRYLSTIEGIIQAIFNRALTLPSQAFTSLELVRLEEVPNSPGRVRIDITIGQAAPGKYFDVTITV